MSINKATLAEMYSGKMLSLPEISRETGVARSTVRQRLIDAGVELRSRADGVRNCKTLGQHAKGQSRPFSELWKRNIGRGRRAWGKVNAVGFSIKSSGYCEVTTGTNKGRGVHVVIMEAIRGYPLDSDQVVHHRDGNPSNNDPVNLKVMSRSDHARLHRKQEKITRGEDGRFTSEVRNVG